MPDCLDLSKFAVTRMSHDLAGVLSAVSVTLGMLEENGGADAESVSLACMGAQSMIARLSFFRAAFGAEGPLTTVEAARQTAENYLNSLENASVQYTCDFQIDSEVVLYVLRLSLLGIQICADSLVRGGQIKVRASGEKLEISAQGAKVMTDGVTDAILNGQTSALNSPKQAAAAFFRETAERNRRHVTFEKSDSFVKIVCCE